jgi:phosphoribosyl 1,2-cyclic phosphodiesterase
MKIVVWGSRGSLPASVHSGIIRQKIFAALRAAQGRQLSSDKDIDRFIDTHLPFSVSGGYGTNTACVEIRDGSEMIVLDAGTGIRDFGNYLMRSGQAPAHIHLFLSHVHWDHICGFPFFVPAYIAANRISIYGFHDNLEQVFAAQQNPPSFPVPLDYMQAKKCFHQLDPHQTCSVAGFRVTGIRQNHPQQSWGYRFEKNGRTIVYATDSEHKADSEDENYPFLEFFRGADLLICDTQYSLTDVVYMREDWGHSSNILCVELAMRACVKHLCMFHSEPTSSDESLDKMLADTRKYAAIYDDTNPLWISLAYDGMEISL